MMTGIAIRKRFAISLILFLFIFPLSSILYAETISSIVVAASNTPDKEKADIVCEGNSDDIEIQSAIDSLPEFGGKILFLSGTYSISNEIKIMNKSNIILQGMGWSTRFLAHQGGLLSGDAVFDIERGGNVTFRDLEIDGNNSAQKIYGITYSSNMPGMKEATFLIENCHILNTTRDCVRTNNQGFNNFTKNLFEYSDERGLHLSSHCYGAAITGNSFKHNTGEGIFFCAVIRYASITGNFFKDNQYGIRGLSSNPGTEYIDSHVVINANTFMRDYRCSIGVDGPVNSVISNNIIGMADLDANDTGDWKWEENGSEDGFDRIGIKIGNASSATTSQLVIMGNSIGENAVNSFQGNWGISKGIQIVNAENIQIIGNQIGLGSQNDSARYNIYGIDLLSNVKDIVIANNSIEDWLDAGIMIRNGQSIDGIQIRNNIVKKSKYRNQKNGIVIAGSNVRNTIISDNIVKSNSLNQIVNLGANTTLRNNITN